jgi:hypothetical protein
MENNDIYKIDFPLVFEYKNYSSMKMKMGRVNYYYCDDLGRWNGVKVYEYIGDSLVRIGSYYENVPISKSEIQKFVIYTNHPIDTMNQIQSELKPYLEKMKARGTTQGKDTLSIGTFKEFKERHPALVKTLLEGDSIGFTISDIENKVDTFIALPIKY